MKGIYLGSKKHRIEGYDLDYNDVVNYPGINVLCDMMDVDINKYDFVIATPPCNYYSRANYRRDVSKVALETKHLLPDMLKKLEGYSKPFIVENVCNSSLLPKTNFYEFEIGNHHYYSNVFMLIDFIPIKQNTSNRGYGYRDGNKNVDIVIRAFLERIYDER